MQFKYIAIVLVSGVVLAGCSLLPGQKTEQPVTQPPEIQVEETMQKDEAVTSGEGVQQEEPGKMAADGTVIEMVADDFKFDVKEIKVKKGEKVTVSLLNSKGFHDFVIDELEVNSGMIPAGETMEIEIPTDKPGTYEYYCSVGQHRQMGMKGTLIVE